MGMTARDFNRNRDYGYHQYSDSYCADMQKVYSHQRMADLERSAEARRDMLTKAFKEMRDLKNQKTQLETQLRNATPEQWRRDREALERAFREKAQLEERLRADTQTNVRYWKRALNAEAQVRQCREVLRAMQGTRDYRNNLAGKKPSSRRG